jgi:SAM-dependent methyltransferase
MSIGGQQMGDTEKLALLIELNKIHKIEDLDVSAINLEISSEDSMFVQGDEDHYYNVGLSGLKQILISLACAQKDKSEIKTILDFPSGWGRELRFIKAYFPDAEITAGEIEEKALRFCKDTFGINTLLSDNDFGQIPIVKNFDLIWCGSLITHLNSNKSTKLLEFFCNVLNEDGILSFTTQGRFAKHLLATEKYMYNLDKAQIETLMHQYELTGYGYVNYRGSNDYGLSLIKPSWIMEFLEKNENMKIILYNEKGYDNHQDVVTCLKRPISYIPKRPWFDRWIEQLQCPKTIYNP